MSVQYIFCPACNHKLGLPVEYLGQEVACPKCSHQFIAPKAMPSTSSDSSAAPTDPTTAGFDPFAKSNVPDTQKHDPFVAFAGDPGPNPAYPAVGLILCALLAGGITLFQLGMALLDKPSTIRQFEQQAQVTAQLMPAGQVAIDPEMMYPIYLALQAAFLGLNVLVLLAGLAMIFRKFYWLGILGSISVMLDLPCCVCLAGAPIGIWSLVVLLNPKTRASFA